MIFGRHPVEDAIRTGAGVDKILLQQGMRGEVERLFRELSKEFNVPLQYVPKERLNALTSSNHQGIIGFMSEMPYYRLEDVLPGVFERGEAPLILVLDGITDVRNFGAIARSAEVFGAHALVVGMKNSAQINSEAVKASAGALLKILVCRESSLARAVEYLINSGLQVYASDLQTDQLPGDLDMTAPLALVLGSEDEGVSRPVIELCTSRFRIPQVGTTDSLNVSVATGIALYEVLRQRTS
jgi:23S rRNA (guanosine2251-2'-O)-methyltransferase